jgi:MFS family permease
VGSAVAFVAVERRSRAPLIDLALLRNQLLIGGTLGILIGAGTINGLMLLVSLYFQDPAALDMSPLEAGLATLPATIGLVALAPAVPRLAKRFKTRTVVAVGFLAMTLGFAVLIATSSSWSYSAFVLPLVAVAAGMALSNGPCSSVSTSAVPAEQVGSASGISNMARYVGAAVMTAIVAAVYGGVSADQIEAGESGADALATAFGWASVVLTVTSAAGIGLALLIARHRTPEPTLVDYAAAAAATSHSLTTPAH